MYILLCCVSYNCTVHGTTLTCISLPIIFCIFMYVTNKILNREELKKVIWRMKNPVLHLLQGNRYSQSVGEVVHQRGHAGEGQDRDQSERQLFNTNNKYACISWMDKLQKSQNKLIRLVVGFSRFTHFKCVVTYRKQTRGIFKVRSHQTRMKRINRAIRV